MSERRRSASKRRNLVGSVHSAPAPNHSTTPFTQQAHSTPSLREVLRQAYSGASLPLRQETLISSSTSLNDVDNRKRLHPATSSAQPLGGLYLPQPSVKKASNNNERYTVCAASAGPVFSLIMDLLMIHSEMAYFEAQKEEHCRGPPQSQRTLFVVAPAPSASSSTYHLPPLVESLHKLTTARSSGGNGLTNYTTGDSPRSSLPTTATAVITPRTTTAGPTTLALALPSHTNPQQQQQWSCSASSSLPKPSSSRRWIPYTAGIGQPPKGGKKKICCNRLQAVNLFLGDKISVEELIEEANVVAMRLRRLSTALSCSSTVTPQCSHERKRNDIPRDERTTMPDTTLVNYYGGLRCLTLKATMVRTLCETFGAKSCFASITPETFILLPRGIQGDERQHWLKTVTRPPPEGSQGCFKDNVWIAKSSHGKGGEQIRIIQCVSHATDEEPQPMQVARAQVSINKALDHIDDQQEVHPWVVQRYVARPLLLEGRKFDIRIWVLLSPGFDVYLYREGVCRMSGEAYDRRDVSNSLVHVTNHCLQTTGTNYGRYESGNELSLADFEKRVLAHRMVKSRNEDETTAARQAQQSSSSASYNTLPPISSQQRNSSTFNNTNTTTINNNVGSYFSKMESKNKNNKDNNTSIPQGMRRLSYKRDIHPQVESIVLSTLTAGKRHLINDPLSPVKSFQLLGFDFIIDEQMKVWLLEINGAPGIAQHLQRRMCEDLVELVIEPTFPTGFHRQDADQRPNGFERIMKAEEWGPGPIV